MHPYESIFASRSVRCSSRMNGNSMNYLVWWRNKGDPKTYVLIGPKCPFTRPTSSSNILCQNRVSNFPCRSEVVVTFIASWPPPNRIWKGTWVTRCLLARSSVTYIGSLGGNRCTIQWSLSGIFLELYQRLCLVELNSSSDIPSQVRSHKIGQTFATLSLLLVIK
jgi:hypothetical protein